MNLTPRQLKIFVSLARTLSFSQTAGFFNVTQPTLSKSVQEIEDAVGVRLFERTTRSVRLTPAGQELVSIATRLVDDFEVGLTELEAQARRRTQWLTIASLPTLAAMLLPEPVAALRREMPQALIRIHDVFTDQALDMLRSRKVDMALTGVDVVHKDLAYTEIVREKFVVLCSARHPVELGTVWSEAALSALPQISSAKGSGSRQLVENAFLRSGFQYRPILDVQSVTTIAGLVKAGCGVAVLPLSGALLVKDDSLKIVYLEGAPERSVGVVTRREARLPPIAARFMQSLRRHARALSHPPGQAERQAGGPCAAARERTTGPA